MMENLKREQAVQYFSDLNPAYLQGKVIGLVGVLGVGKTQFVKSVVASMLPEAADQVNSPTYNICNIYQVKNLQIHHYDLYRIESEDDLYETGIFDSFEAGSALVFIEWVDLFPVLEERCDEILYLETGKKDGSSVQYHLTVKK